MRPAMRMAGAPPASVLLACSFSLSLALASEIPVPRPPAICDLSAARGGDGQVLLRWRGGTPPFTVIRAETADFTAAAHVVVLTADVAIREFRDPVDGRDRYWYLVVDRNKPPLLFRTDPRDPHEGDLVTIHGVGFNRDCKQNRLILGGRLDAVPLQNCTAMTVQFQVPLHVVSEAPMVMSERGLGTFGSLVEDCEGIPRGPVTWGSRESR